MNIGDEVRVLSNCSYEEYIGTVGTVTVVTNSYVEMRSTNGTLLGFTRNQVGPNVPSQPWKGEAFQASLREEPLSTNIGVVADFVENKWPAVTPPASRDDIVAELVAAAGEHNDVKVSLAGHRLELSWVIDKVVLEDDNGVSYDLGRFRPRIKVTYSRDYCDVKFEARALEANYCSQGDYCHPHVGSAGAICMGDGLQAARNAVYQCRLPDAFALVESVLRTYSSDSPHFPLEEWVGRGCGNCESRSHDFLDDCKFCGEDVCADCDYVSWDDYRAHSGCAFYCESCESYVGEEEIRSVGNTSACDDCCGSCNGCGESFLNGDLADDRCEKCRLEPCIKCGTAVGHDELDEDSRCGACAFEECADCGTKHESENLTDGVCSDCESDDEEDEDDFVEEEVQGPLQKGPGTGLAVEAGRCTSCRAKRGEAQLYQGLCAHCYGT